MINDTQTICSAGGFPIRIMRAFERGAVRWPLAQL
jgi:hypothetical protein